MAGCWKNYPGDISSPPTGAGALMLGFLANEGIELFPSNPMLTEDELSTF